MNNYKYSLSQAYIIKTPPVRKLQSESTNLLSEQSMRKKQKVLLQLDTQSDSSEHSDLLVKSESKKHTYAFLCTLLYIRMYREHVGFQDNIYVYICVSVILSGTAFQCTE